MERKIFHVVNFSFVIPFFLGDQITHFQEKGYEIFISCTASEHAYNYAKEKGFTFFPVTIPRKISIISDLIAIIKLIRIIRREKIRIVVGHTPKGGLLSMIAASLAGVKNRIYFRHGLMYETSKGFKKILFKGIEKFTGNIASKVVCVSTSVLDISNQESLSSPRKNIILGKGSCNGINTIFFDNARVSPEEKESVRHELGINQDAVVIGFVGRIVKDKGIEELIEAWKIIRTSFSNVFLLLVGPLEERDKVNDSTLQSIKSDNSIISSGLTKNIRSYYSIMDIFILPSYREGFPTVVLEASAMSLPVITTRSTGCIDSIIENQTGVFADIEAGDLAGKISEYIQNPEIRQVHGQNGRNFVVSDYSQEAIWNEILHKIIMN